MRLTATAVDHKRRRGGKQPVISIGVAGLGYWGPNLVRNVNATMRTALAWLCDSDAERLEAIGRQHPNARRSTQFEAMLADDRLDAVVIATPAATHYRLARAALRAGKHVLVEKPLTTSVAEADELVALAAQHQRVLLVDHIFLYTPAVAKMAELVGAGALGDLVFFDAVRINLGIFQHDVSVLWDLAPHDVSIIDYLIGRAPESVVAIGASRTIDGLEDVVYVHLEYGGGLLASLHLNWLSPVKVRHFLAGGSARSILYNDLDASERLKVYDRGVDLSSDPAGLRDALISFQVGDVISPRLDATEPLFRLVEHFADCVEHRIAPISGGEQGLRIVRVLAAAEESLRRGSQRVRL